MFTAFLLLLLFAFDTPSRSVLGPTDEMRASNGKIFAPSRSVLRAIELLPPDGYTAEDFVAFVRPPGCAWPRRPIHARGLRLGAASSQTVEVPGDVVPPAPCVLAVVSDDGLWADAVPLTALAEPETLALRPRSHGSLTLDIRLAANPRDDLPNGDWSLAQERGPLVELVRLTPRPGYAGTYSASAREDLTVGALPPGTYRVRVFADAYEPTESELELSAGERTFASVHLRPLAPDARADLQVRYVFEEGPPHGAAGGSGDDRFAVEVRSLARGPEGWVQSLPDFTCVGEGRPRAPGDVRLDRLGGDGCSALGFVLTDLRRNQPVVVRTDPPAGFTAAGQVLARPGGEALRIPVLRKPADGGFGFRIVNAASGRELESYSLSAVDADRDFPLPLGAHASGAGLVASAPPGGIAWRIDAPGFVPAFGATDAFRSGPMHTVQLQPGWGTDVVVQDHHGAPVAGASLWADGLRVGVTAADGRARLVLDSRPEVVTARHRDWVHVRALPGTPRGRIVLAPPL